MRIHISQSAHFEEAWNKIISLINFLERKNISFKMVF